jgi:hypothetical protein
MNHANRSPKPAPYSSFDCDDDEVSVVRMRAPQAKGRRRWALPDELRRDPMAIRDVSIRVASLALLLTSSTGCTLVGLAGGAATPAYETFQPEKHKLKIGDNVRVRVAVLAPVVPTIRGWVDSEEGWISGRYAGQRGGAFFMTDASKNPACGLGVPRDALPEGATTRRDTDCVLASSSILEVHVQEGSRWGTGLAIGFLIDLAVAGIAGAIVYDGFSGLK